MINAQQIKELRDKTGVSVSSCKKALEETAGDMEKALIVLQRESAKSAEKKADRTLGAGVVEAYIHNNKKTGVLVELMSESDFVSGNEDFRMLAKDIAMHIVASSPVDLIELAGQSYIKNPSITIKELVNQAVQKFGEKIEVSKFARYSLS
ncbi:MAG: translation elongation factor Ts [Patescibacteria group bacterium]